MRSVAEFMQESIAFLVRVQCRRKESSRSLSHLLMSFLYNLSHAICYSYGTVVDKPLRRTTTDTQDSSIHQ